MQNLSLGIIWSSLKCIFPYILFTLENRKFNFFVFISFSSRIDRSPRKFSISWKYCLKLWLWSDQTYSEILLQIISHKYSSIFPIFQLSFWNLLIYCIIDVSNAPFSCLFYIKGAGLYFQENKMLPWKREIPDRIWYESSIFTHFWWQWFCLPIFYYQINFANAYYTLSKR